MEYRIKYIFKGTRDKGHEIADCHGTYMLYDNMQERRCPALLNTWRRDLNFQNCQKQST